MGLNFCSFMTIRYEFKNQKRWLVQWYFWKCTNWSSLTKWGFFTHNCPKNLLIFIQKNNLFLTSILFSIMVWWGSQTNSLETVCACQCIFIYSSISITGPIICLQSGSLQTNYPCENTRLHFFEIESFGLNHLLGRYSFAFINSVQHGYMYWKRIILISNLMAHLR